MTETIFHIADPGDWAARTEHYQAPSLIAEGFIHCSTAAQLVSVLDRHFGGRTDLVILEIDPMRLEATIIYEDLYGLGEDYPHVYGVIPLNAIVDSREHGQVH